MAASPAPAVLLTAPSPPAAAALPAALVAALVGILEVERHVAMLDFFFGAIVEEDDDEDRSAVHELGFAQMMHAPYLARQRCQGTDANDHLWDQRSLVVRQGGSHCTKSGEHEMARRSGQGHFTQVRAAAKRKTLLLLLVDLIGKTQVVPRALSPARITFGEKELLGEYKCPGCDP